MARVTPTYDDLLTRLTPAQRQAVISPSPRLAVYAGAGAGKTRVLTLRIARMVDDGVDPTQILAITFSRKAAQELRRRLWELSIEGIRTGTFHRTALDLVEVYRAEHHQPPVSLITDRRSVLQRLIESDTEGRRTLNAAFVDTEITWAKSRGLTPDEYPNAAKSARRRTSQSPYQLQHLWLRYEESARSRNALDFDDLISEAIRALSDPTFAAAIHWRSRHLLVDEFQDVNPMQYLFIEKLLSPTATFFCVGDPNQSIYGFNGADPSLLSTLDQRMADTEILALDANHRSTPEIVSSAAAVLDQHHRRETTATQNSGAIPILRGLEDDLAEAQFVASTFRSLRTPGRHWRSFAVLARTNAQLRVITDVFTAAGIPTELLAPETTPASDVKKPLDQVRPGAPTVGEDDAVKLGTFHRAKGLEWPTVAIIGASEGLVPYRSAATPAQLDEERRLLYVALTRAELELVVTWSRHVDAADGKTPRRQSPFLSGFDTAIRMMGQSNHDASGVSGAQKARSLRESLQERLKK
jgi:DNA helicase-2/ATP-dependent DNA helicase PcrA